MVKSQPCPTTLFNESSPPINAVIFRVIDKPNPKPSAFSVAERRVNSPNIRSCSSGGIPGPESLTSTFSRTLLSVKAVMDITMTTRPSRVNLRAFDNKLPTTWRIRIGSPIYNLSVPSSFRFRTNVRSFDSAIGRKLVNISLNKADTLNGTRCISIFPDSSR